MSDLFQVHVFIVLLNEGLTSRVYLYLSIAFKCCEWARHFVLTVLRTCSRRSFLKMKDVGAKWTDSYIFIEYVHGPQ